MLIHSLSINNFVFFPSPSSKNYIDYMDIENSIQTYLILLCFTLLHFEDIMFLQIESFGKLSQVSIGAIFPTALFSN